MWPDRVSSPGPLALESDALPTVLRGPADKTDKVACAPNEKTYQPGKPPGLMSLLSACR